MNEGVGELSVAWQRHVGVSASADTWFTSVLSRHREPHRSYHDVRHVRWVVRHVHELAGHHRLADLDATIVAAFFHDVVYDPTSPENEQASAALAADALRELGWAGDRITAVEQMILGTAGHLWNRGATVDATVLYAADLGVLAAEPAGYSAYVRNVRREYRHVNDADWAAGRSAVLRGFLDRDAIYAPALGLTVWEARARGNLTSELDSITA